MAPASLRADRPPTLSELAHTLGYSDHAHMTREFTRTMGVTPSRYRIEALAAPVVRQVGAVAFERSVPLGTVGRATPTAAAPPAGRKSGAGAEVG